MHPAHTHAHNHAHPRAGPPPEPRADAEGDGTAFEREVQREMPRLLGTAIRLLGPGFAAEEAVAEAIAKAWLGHERFRGDSRLGTWVHRILYRVVADRYRRRSRDRRQRDRLTERARAEERAGSARADAAAHLAGIELDHELRAALAHLPEAQQIVLLLHAWEGLTLTEVAEVLGRRYATVKSNLHHARKRLAQELGWEGTP